MFSKGQLIFALVFFVAFVIGITIAYRKDKKSNQDFFKGSYKVLIVIILVFFLLFSVVKLKNLLF
jgi:hypothetical protein